MAGGMDGRVVLITGANSGIGLETSRGLAALGAHVVMACRDRARCDAAMAEVQHSTGSDSVEGIVADLSVMGCVRSLAEEFKESHDRLDVLVNNAAIVPRRRQVSADGIELQLAVNHLAPFLLTHLLLDPLLASAPSRVVNVASNTHRRASIDLDDLQAERAYRGMARYGTTKLCNILFTRALARRLAGTGVTANACTPGFRWTRLSRDFGPVSRGMVRLIAGKAEEGARVVTWAASAPELASSSGLYYRKNAVEEPSDLARDDALGERLWRASEELARIRPGELEARVSATMEVLPSEGRA